MEKMPDIQNDTSGNNGRRNFLKKMAILTGGALVFPSIGLDVLANDNFFKENNVEIFIKNEIEKCRDIIQSNKYEEVINNPFLVSVLYYSSNLINKIRVSQASNLQRVIAGISRYITPEFRQNYMKTLDNISKIKDDKNIISGVEKIPLERLSIPKDLSKNHEDAIDLFIEEGSPMFPMACGLVVLSESGWSEENEFTTSSEKGGNTVIIYNSINKSFYRYVHMENVFVTTGDIVDTNTIIGTVGHTGLNANKPGHGGHLHLEVNVYHDQQNEIKPTHVLELKDRLLDIYNKNKLLANN